MSCAERLTRSVHEARARRQVSKNDPIQFMVALEYGADDGNGRVNGGLCGGPSMKGDP
jgi:hypothetical protein